MSDTDAPPVPPATEEESENDFFQPPCVICQDDLVVTEEGSLIRGFSCGHKYHYRCVLRGQITVCPLCRESVAEQRLCSKCMTPIKNTYQLVQKTYALCSICMINKVEDQSREKSQILMVYNKNVACLEANYMRILAGYDAGISATSCLESLAVELKQFFRGSDNIHSAMINNLD